MSTSESLRQWASNRGDAKAEFARQVADALGKEDEWTKWSLIDLRREFDCRSSDARPLLTALSSLSALTFILPVLVAWIHLRDVFSQFRDAVRAAGADEQINFLAFWTGAYEGRPWAYDGTSASGVAVWVVVLVVLVVGLQGLIGLAETVSSNRDRALDGLITEASLKFASKRAINPEELAGEIRVAALELERGLANLTEAFENTRALVQEVEGFAGVITRSAETLESSSMTLAATMAPLSAFSEAANSAEKTLLNAVSALDRAEKAFAEGTKENAGVLSDARQMLTSGVRESADAIGAVRSGAESAASLISQATGGLANVVDSSLGISSSFAQTTRELERAIEAVKKTASEMASVSQSVAGSAQTLASVAASADSPQVQSYVLAVQDVSSHMAESANKMVGAVQHMSEQLQKWSEDVSKG